MNQVVVVLSLGAGKGAWHLALQQNQVGKAKFCYACYSRRQERDAFAYPATSDLNPYLFRKSQWRQTLAYM